MKRNFDLKRRECRNLPPEKLKATLSQIYPEETVADLMGKFFGTEKQTPPTEKGGEQE